MVCMYNSIGCTVSWPRCMFRRQDEEIRFKSETCRHCKCETAA